MKEIWLFGDSYAQQSRIVFDATKDDIDYNFVSWPCRLEQKYNLKNFARGGTGPTWSLNVLHDAVLKEENLKNVTCIFLVSAIWRLDLDFYQDPSDQFLTSKIPVPDTNMINFGWNIFDLNNEEKQIIKPYKSQTKFVKDLWKNFLLTDSFQNTEILKIIGNLKLYSNMFEKILIWPIFHKPIIEITSEHNFYYVKDLLFEIEKDSYNFGYDPRPNHLSEPNHEIMFDQLCNWIEKNQSIDISKFKKY